MSVEFQLIPQSAFELNLRNQMENWTNLSKKIREKANYVCEYCGEYHPEKWGTEAHEEWDYSKPNILKLKRIVCVCHKCHMAVHPGAANHYEGEEAGFAALLHYGKINNLDIVDTIKDYEKARIKQLERNKYKWVLDENLFKQVEEQYGFKCIKKPKMIEF